MHTAITKYYRISSPKLQKMSFCGHAVLVLYLLYNITEVNGIQLVLLKAF